MKCNSIQTRQFPISILELINMSRKKTVLTLLFFIILLFPSVKNVYGCWAPEPPSASIGVDNATPVVGEEVTFTATNQSNVFSATWTFGEGANPQTVDDAESVNVTYSTYGTKEVVLEIQNSRGTTRYADPNPLNVYVGDPPTPGSIGGSQTICSGDTPAELTSTVAGGGSVNTNIVYQWEANAGGSWGTISGTTGATYQPPDLTATASYRRRTVTDWGGTTRYSGYTGEVTVTVNELPLFITEKTDVKCFGGNDGCIKVTATGGSGSYFYSKDNGATYTSTAQSGFYTFEGLEAGDYKIRVKDTNGCETPFCE